jgi:hypothetical protein
MLYVLGQKTQQCGEGLLHDGTERDLRRSQEKLDRVRLRPAF